jgi:DNA-binding MarR family transcriptional regulator
MNDTGVNDTDEKESLDIELLLRSLSSAGRAVDSQLDASLSRHGLSIAKFSVLKVLAKANTPLALSGIAERLACVRSNVTQLVDSLEEEGLVRRVRDVGDRRSIRAALTDEGRRLYLLGVEEEAKVELELFQGFSLAEQEQLQGLLKRFAKK